MKNSNYDGQWLNRRSSLCAFFKFFSCGTLSVFLNKNFAPLYMTQLSSPELGVLDWLCINQIIKKRKYSASIQILDRRQKDTYTEIRSDDKRLINISWNIKY